MQAWFFWTKLNWIKLNKIDWENLFKYLDLLANNDTSFHYPWLWTRTARIDRRLYRLMKIGINRYRHFLAPKIECNVTFSDILVSYSFFPSSFASRYEIFLNSVQLQLQYNINKQILGKHAFVEKCHTYSDSSFLNSLGRHRDVKVSYHYCSTFFLFSESENMQNMM